MFERLKSNARLIAILTLILALTVTGISAISAGLQVLNPLDYPIWLQNPIITLQALFAIPFVAFAIVFMRNAYGYYRKQIAVNDPNLKVDLQKITKTIALYLTFASGAVATLPPEWANAVIGFVAFVDLLVHEIVYFLNGQ
jgi:hypothetical protein